jgi:hypothetical protein
MQIRRSILNSEGAANPSACFAGAKKSGWSASLDHGAVETFF